MMNSSGEHRLQMLCVCARAVSGGHLEMRFPHIHEHEPAEQQDTDTRVDDLHRV